MKIDKRSRIDFDLEGHRGARGLAPENTIPAFIRALDLGVNTLELDVVVTADCEVVVSHDPWFSSQICLHPDERPVTKSEEKSLVIFAMTYEEVAGYDCGSRGHPNFPEQRAIEAAKPLLKEVIRTSEAHSDSTSRPPVCYNIEIKSSPERDGVYYSSVSEYARLLYDVLSENRVLDRALVQSFDPRALEAIKKVDPAVAIVLLVSNNKGIDKNLAQLSFKPDVYSPNEYLVDQELVSAAHRLNIRVIPWTVNEMDRMKELIMLGVDGFITDYPDRGVEVLATLPE